MVSEEASSSSTTEEDKLILLYGKISLIVVLCITTVLSSFLPWIIIKRYKNNTNLAIEIIAIGSCFTAGVIIGAGFSHLLPDAIEAWERYYTHDGANSSGRFSGYPWASLLSIFTMFALIYIDKIFVDKGVEGESKEHNHNHMVIELEPHAHHKHHSDSTAKTVGVHADEGGDHNHNNNTSSTVNLHVNGKHRDGGDSGSDDDSDADNGTPTNQEARVSRITASITHGKVVPFTKLVDNEDDTSSVSSSSSSGGGGGGGNITPQNSESPSSPLSQSTLSSSSPLSSSPTYGSNKAISRAYIFFVALSMHSLFDGLGIGAEDNVSGFFGLLIAVAGHKLLDGFALGVPLYYANLPRYQVVTAILFCAAMTPLGTAIGMIATAGYNGSSAQLAKAFILSVSAGSFFFISLMELLPSGLAQGGRMKLKLTAAFSGWSIMAFLALWV